MKIRIFGVLVTALLVLSLLPPASFAIFDHWQVIDKTGKVVIAPRTNSLTTAFHEGMACVAYTTGDEQVGRRTHAGFIDKKGNWAIPIRLSDAFIEGCIRHFSEGLVAKEYRGDPSKDPCYDKHSLGFVDRSGKMVISPWRLRLDNSSEQVCNLAFDFSEGLSLIRKDHVYVGSAAHLNREYSFVNKSGETVLKLGKDMGAIEQNIVSDFDSYANCDCTRILGDTLKGDCEVRRKGSSFSNGFSLVTYKGKYGFIDKNGKWLGPTYDFALPFSEGLAFVRTSDKAGFIDTSGKMTIQFPLRPKLKIYAASFHEGLCKLAILDESNWHREFRYIDRNGKTAFSLDQKKLDAAYLELGDFSSGRALIVLKSVRPDSFGYVDKSGNWKIPPKVYTYADRFYDGVARFLNEDGRSGGYIDTNGKVIWSSKMFNGTPCVDGIMGVFVD